MIYSEVKLFCWKSSKQSFFLKPFSKLPHPMPSALSTLCCRAHFHSMKHPALIWVYSWGLWPPVSPGPLTFLPTLPFIHMAEVGPLSCLLLSQSRGSAFGFCWVTIMVCAQAHRYPMGRLQIHATRPLAAWRLQREGGREALREAAASGGWWLPPVLAFHPAKVLVWSYIIMQLRTSTPNGQSQEVRDHRQCTEQWQDRCPSSSPLQCPSLLGWSVIPSAAL